MYGLNEDAVSEMLEYHGRIKKKLAVMRHCSKFLIREVSKQRVAQKIDNLEKDLRFTLMVLQDEFVLGLPNSEVARDFGLLAEKDTLVRPLNLAF